MPTRKAGSTLQPVTIDVAIPTDVDLTEGAIVGITLRIAEGVPPYVPLLADAIPAEDWSLSGAAPDQVLTLTWREDLNAEPLLVPGAYIGEVHIETLNGQLIAPNDGYVKLHMQETLAAPEGS